MQNWAEKYRRNKKQQPSVASWHSDKTLSFKPNPEKNVKNFNGLRIFVVRKPRKTPLSRNQKFFEFVGAEIRTEICVCRKKIKANTQEIIIHCILCSELYHRRCFHITHMVIKNIHNHGKSWICQACLLYLEKSIIKPVFIKYLTSKIPIIFY